MSANLLTEKSRCIADCPGYFPYKERGELIECRHGAYFMVDVDHVRRDSPRWAFKRLSRFWNPVLFRRAQIAVSEEAKPS